MWYVMQVRTGREEETLSMVHQCAADSHMGVCFLPKYEQKKKFAGDWHLVQALLFPGYVFVETEEIEKFYMGLKQVPKLTKILGTGECWTSIIDEDLRVLERLLDEEKVAAVPGTAFGACGEGFLRVSYAYSLDDLREAIARLGRFVERLRSQG